MSRELLQMVFTAMSYGNAEDRESARLAVKVVLDEQPAPVQYPPPECQTEAEKRAYAFGWWKALEAQRALDKMAENARELGLDYEPATEESSAVAAPIPENFMDALRFDVAMRDAAQPAVPDAFGTREGEHPE